jgi:predicted HTH domain antitoxin
MTEMTPEIPDELLAIADNDEGEQARAALLEHYRRRAVLLNREVRLLQLERDQLRERLEVFETADDDDQERTEPHGAD